MSFLFNAVSSLLGRGFKASPPETGPERASAAAEATYPGIRNQTGSDCFLIALLQMIANTPSLEKILLQSCEHILSCSTSGKDKDAAKTILIQYLQLKDDRARMLGQSYVSSKSVRQAFYDLHLCHRLSGHEDSAEVLLRLLDRYDEATKHIGPSQEVVKCLLNHKKTYEPQDAVKPADSHRIALTEILPNDPQAYSYLDTENSHVKQEYTHIIPLAVPTSFQRKLEKFAKEKCSLPTVDAQQKKNALFSELMMHFFADIEQAEPAWYLDKELGMLRQYKCMKQSISFSKAPEELMFMIRRFNEDRSKISLQIPMQQSFSLSEDIAGQNASYELDSFVVHMGSTGAGHYISYQKIEGSWFCFNDSRCTKCSADEIQKALEESYYQHYVKSKDFDPSSAFISTEPDAHNMESTSAMEFTPSLSRIPLLSEQHIRSVKQLEEINEIESLLSWNDAYIEGKSSIQKMPLIFTHKLHEMLWLKDNMPDVYLYGQHEMDKNPSSIHTPCPPILYCKGSDLLEQLIEKEKARHHKLCLQKQIDLLQAIKATLSMRAPIKTEINRLYEMLDAHWQKEMLLELAKRRGIGHAKAELEGKCRFGEEKTHGDFSTLKDLYTYEDLADRLFPGESLKSVDKNDEMQKFIESLKNPNTPQGQIESHFSILSTENKNIVYRLVYFCHLSQRSFDYAYGCAKTNIGIFSVTSGADTSIIDHVIGSAEKALALCEEDAEAKTSAQKIMVQEDPSLTSRQKIEILRRI